MTSVMAASPSSNHSPDRVSAILRSSTRTSRDIGIGTSTGDPVVRRDPRRAGTGTGVAGLVVAGLVVAGLVVVGLVLAVVVMLLLLRAGCLR
ncbi:hypothetical protein GCM10009843_12650 [Nocardioides bigeumensis]|uniref:Uncharacterized protein n=1 Tax=Nocardioides bigeumensis TaxID=433657 RepID=A0ABP5JSR2_9ACTN